LTRGGVAINRAISFVTSVIAAAARWAFMSSTRIRDSTSRTMVGANGATGRIWASVFASSSSCAVFAAIVADSCARSDLACGVSRDESIRVIAACQLASNRSSRAMRDGDTGSSDGGGGCSVLPARPRRPPPPRAAPFA
jgi:hypothetical protein